MCQCSVLNAGINDAVIFPATNDQSKITRITVARGSSHEANHCAGRYGDVRDRRLCGHRIGDSQCRLTEVFIDPPPRGLEWCAHDATVCRPGSGPRLRSNRSTPLKAPLQVVVSGDAPPSASSRAREPGYAHNRERRSAEYLRSSAILMVNGRCLQ